MTRLLLLTVALCGLARAAQAQHTPAAVTGQPVVCAGGNAAGFACSSVNLMAFLPVSDLGGAVTDSINVRMNDLWGWTDPATGREYVLAGRTDGTAFVDVTDPANPVFLGKLPTRAGQSVWRDVKVYQDHAFIVADNTGPHGMQVFDLTQLRAVTNPPVAFTETAVYEGFTDAHNLALNEATGFAYAVGGETCGGALHMVDVRQPLRPVFAGCFADPTTGFAQTGYTHDAQCVVYHGPDVEHQGKEICIGANETALSIADVTDKTDVVDGICRSCTALSTGTYPNFRYVHQGWLTEDHRYFFQGDELDELGATPVVNATRTLIWDLTDLDDPLLLAEYLGATDTIDHNQYVVGDLLYQANYTGGLRILYIGDVARPVEVAFFDTFPSNDAPQFGGAWGVYPFFESGLTVVTGIGEGLFMLEPFLPANVATEPAETPTAFTLSPAYPNPFNPQTTFTLTLPASQRVTVAVYDVLGRQAALLHDGALAAGPHRLTFDATGLPGGTYLVRAVGPQATQTRLVTLVK